MKTKIQKTHFFVGILAIFCLFFCIFSFFCTFGTAFASGTTYVISATNAVVFEEPDISSTAISTLSHKDEVEIESDSNGAIKYSGTGVSVDFSFYRIVDSGYVLCDLLSAKTSQVTQIPSFNAELNESAQVYEISGNNFISTGITLDEGTRVYLYEGYDDDLAMTAICYLYNDEVCYGYILTSTLSPDGLNPAIIVCAILIVALLGIIFAWLFIKNRERIIRKEGKKALKEQKKQKKAEKIAKKQAKKQKLNQNQ